MQAIPLTYSPRILMGMIEANRRILTPYYQAPLEEGTGTAPSAPTIPGNWRSSSPSSPACGCLPSVFPRHQGGDEAKVPVSRGDAGGDGVPLFDESIQKVVDQFFDQIPEDLAPRRQNKIAATAILFSANTFIR